MAKLTVRVFEVGISYAGRTYEEGKKIGWKDGVRALWCIVKSQRVPLMRRLRRSSRSGHSLRAEHSPKIRVNVFTQ